MRQLRGGDVDSQSVGVTRVGGWVFWLLALGWIFMGLLIALGLAYVMSDPQWDSYCEHESGDSDFGDGTWSWWPLGVECTWSQGSGNLVDDHEEPGWGQTVFTGAYLASGVVMVRWARVRWAAAHRSPFARTVA